MLITTDEDKDSIMKTYQDEDNIKLKRFTSISR